jgi:hypothetical protein
MKVLAERKGETINDIIMERVDAYRKIRADSVTGV